MNDEIKSLGFLIEKKGIRSLFHNYCSEVMKFSDGISADVTLFEARFTGECGMRITVSVYRELFIVSAGKDSSVDIRVTDHRGLIKALDISVTHFLKTASEFFSLRV